MTADVPAGTGSRARLAAWLRPPRPDGPVATGREGRLLRTELIVVFAVTLGLSGVRSLVSLLDVLAAPVPLDQRRVAIDTPLGRNAWADLAAQLAGSLTLVAWGALGLLLLVRAGAGPRRIGLDGRRPLADALGAVGLAALIGVPGSASTSAPGRSGSTSPWCPTAARQSTGGPCRSC